MDETAHKGRSNKEAAMKRTLIAVHQGLANIYNHRIFQYVRPELCIKLEVYVYDICYVVICCDIHLFYNFVITYYQNRPKLKNMVN